MIHNLNGTLRKDLTTSLSPFSLTLQHLLQLSLSPSSWCDLSSFLTRTNLGKFFLRQELYDGIKSAKYKVQSVSIYNTLLVRVCWQQCVHTHTHTSTHTHTHTINVHTSTHVCTPQTHTSAHIHTNMNIYPPPTPHTNTQCMFEHTHTQPPSFLTLLWPMTTALSLLCFLSFSSTTLGSCSGSATFLCELIAITAAADQTVENRSYKAIKCIVETYTCVTHVHMQTVTIETNLHIYLDVFVFPFCFVSV